jgi:hypothetical protein
MPGFRSQGRIRRPEHDEQDVDILVERVFEEDLRQSTGAQEFAETVVQAPGKLIEIGSATSTLSLRKIMEGLFERRGGFRLQGNRAVVGTRRHASSLAGELRSSNASLYRTSKETAASTRYDETRPSKNKSRRPFGLWLYVGFYVGLNPKINVTC